MNLNGKKIVCFSGMPSHTRFFLPIREKIINFGGNFLFIVPLGDYPYELEMIRQRLMFRYYTDYMNHEVKGKIKNAMQSILNEWTGICYKWDGFSRWPLFKQSWFFEALIEEYFCMERFIEEEKPDLFLAHHEMNRWGKTIGHLAFKKSVPFVTFQEGDYYYYTPGFPCHTEYSTVDLLWGDRTLKYLEKFGCSHDKMLPIGDTHIDGAIKEHTSPRILADIRMELNIPSGKKVVLFFLDIFYGGNGDKSFWEERLKGIECLTDEAICIIKWHPLVHRSTYEKIEAMFKELYPQIILFQTYDPYKLLAIADYCVVFGRTTLAIEALAFGKPLFSFSDPSVDMYGTEMRIAQTIYPSGNWSNLLNTMENGVPQHMQENVDKCVREYFYKLDGKSVDRAINVINYVINIGRFKQEAKFKGQGAINDKTHTPGRISYIVPSGKDAEALLATLTSLSQNVKYQDWEVIVTVNDKNMKGMLSCMSGDIRIIEKSSDVLSVLYNRGAGASSGEYLVFMRPGIVYFKDEGLLYVMRAGIAGMPLKNPDMTPYCLGIDYDFNFTPFFIKKEPDLGAGCSTQYASREAVGGGFIAMQRDIFKTLGGFDEGIANHLIEADICLKAKCSNIPISYLPEALGFNYKETFFSEDLSYDNWKNRVKFFAKWCGKLPKDDDFIKYAGDLLKV